jgi:hypothetical protein
MTLDLTEEEAAALTNLLKRAISDDHFLLSPRVQTLRAILDQLEPRPPQPAASPEPRVYAPPRAKKNTGEGKG